MVKGQAQNVKNYLFSKDGAAIDVNKDAQTKTKKVNKPLPAKHKFVKQSSEMLKIPSVCHKYGILTRAFYKRIVTTHIQGRSLGNK